MITQKPDRILKDLLSKLETEQSSYSITLPEIVTAIGTTSKALHDLERYIDETVLEEDEEINIFKRIKPQIDGRLIYYLRLAEVVENTPFSGIDEKLSYFKEELSKLMTFYASNKDIALYHKFDHSHLDKTYFTRQHNTQLIPAWDYVSISDQQHNAPKSHTFAKICAYELIRQYLEQQIILISQKDVVSGEKKASGTLIRWTGTKAAFVELVTALNEAGVLNGKKQEVKKVFEYLGAIFDLSIDNPYKIGEDNRLRKKNPHPFLSLLINVLLRKYDYDDEYSLG